MEEKLPDLSGIHKQVVYIDPLNTKSENIDVFVSKHFRYAYQKEYRITWLPTKVEKKLDHQDIVIGNLEILCELISLNS
ncbi:MAG: hypothetical protein NT009_13000 [Proteobacteria bacterium]|nr:hypothetical protein [Pseudomonadota bacterium]